MTLPNPSKNVMFALSGGISILYSFFLLTNKLDEKKLSSFEYKYNQLKAATSNILSDSSIKELNIAYSYNGAEKTFKHTDFYLMIDRSYDIEKARIEVIEKHLKCLKAINSQQFLSNYLAPFPLTIKNISIFIYFCSHPSLKPRISPHLLRIRADKGVIEYLSSFGFGEKYDGPFFKEDFFSAYEKVKNYIDPELKEVAQKIVNHKSEVLNSTSNNG